MIYKVCSIFNSATVDVISKTLFTHCFSDGSESNPPKTGENNNGKPKPKGKRNP